MTDAPRPITNDARRQAVARAYGQAIRRAQDGATSCCPSAPSAESADAGAGCGTAASDDPGEPVGVAARTAGYGGEVDDVPAAASCASFGCGNPLALSDVQPGDTVLDLGSGAGLDLILAARLVGPAGRVLGVDMTADMIAVARDNLVAAGIDNAEVLEGIIEQLPVEDGSVDRVVSNCVINLSPEKHRVFAEIHRVLEPGGTFCIADLVAEDLPAALRDHSHAWSACIAGAISEAEYVSGLEAAGLVDVQVVDRLVYEREQLVGMVATDLEAHGLPAHALDEALAAAVGKVWSVRVSGRRPEVPVERAPTSGS